MKDVLIVGAGPTGLVLACELVKYGVSFDIIEKNAINIRQSKALSISSATLKAFHGLGVVEDILKEGNKLQDILVHFDKKRIAHINMNHIDSPYNCYLTIPQPDTERILEGHLNKSGVFVNYNCELKTLIQSVGSVLVDMDLEGDILTKKYKYIVGCDGARSKVRTLLKCPFEGFDYNMYFIMADVKFEGAQVYNVAHYYVDEKGFLIFLPMRNGLTRIVIKKSGVYPVERFTPTLEAFQDYLNQYVPFKPKISKIVWRSSAPFYNRLASNNIFDRVFLSGDSYHLFSPIGGQGMNTGIQDALNLGWKLGYVLGGLASKDLLLTYSMERMSAVKNMLDVTHTNTMLISRKWKNKKNDECGLYRYVPSMKNRSYYKTQMADEFSGLLSGYHCENSSDLTGKQVPYVAFDNMTTFDVATNKKHVLFIKRGGCSFELQKILEKYPDSIKLCEIDVASSDKLKLSRYYCLVRPDGYVGLHNQYENLEALNAYFARYFTVSHGVGV